MKKEPEIIKLEIPNQEDRENLIISLINCDYKVWIEKRPVTFGNNYFVCFEKP